MISQKLYGKNYKDKLDLEKLTVKYPDTVTNNREKSRKNASLKKETKNHNQINLKKFNSKQMKKGLK